MPNFFTSSGMNMNENVYEMMHAWYVTVGRESVVILSKRRTVRI